MAMDLVALTPGSTRQETVKPRVDSDYKPANLRRTGSRKDSQPGCCRVPEIISNEVTDNG